MVIVRGAMAGEFTDGVQDGAAERLSTARRERLEDGFHTVEAEFFSGLVVVAVAFDYPVRNQQQGRTFLETHSGGIAGRVGKESKWQSGGAEFGDSRGITKKAGRVSGVGVAEGPELLMVAAEKSRTGMHSLGEVNEAAIEPEIEFAHDLGFINVRPGEEFGARGAENLLCDIEDAAVVFASSGYVEQAE